MTLVLSVVGPESVWTVADRRLTAGNVILPKSARKLMVLETTDGFGVLAYAGVGSTGQGTEPADWMSRVLRGRNWPFEQSLGALAEALKREMPPHLARLRVAGPPSHTIVASAFVAGEARLYTIDLAMSADRRKTWFRHTRWYVPTWGSPQRPPRTAMGGSGVQALLNDRTWRRPLLRLVRAHDRHQVSPESVADELASINYRAHIATRDNTVGPDCIVVWRNRKGGAHNGGGKHMSYTATSRDRDTPAIPMIANGMDMNALLDVVGRHTFPEMFARMRGEAYVRPEGPTMDQELANLPADPDERLK